MLHKINKSAGFLLCLAAFCCSWSTCAAHLQPVVEEPACPATARDLCIEFRDLRDLIPSNMMVSITARHYQRDSKFRQAMRFLRSAAFNNVARQIDQSEVYEQLLQPFADAGVNTETLESITAVLDCLMLPAADQDFAANSRSIAPAPRSLQSYSVELLAAIPRQQFQDLIATNLGNNPEFAAFYQIVRNSAYQRLVMNALASRELRQPIRVLKKHNIDVHQLVAQVFELFSWGPSDF